MPHLTRLRDWVASATLGAMLVTGGAAAVTGTAPAPPPTDVHARLAAATATAPTRAAIAQLAYSQLGNHCTPYMPGGNCDPDLWWCAYFAKWVWQQSGVAGVDWDGFARDVGVWGQQHNVWKARPAGQEGDPEVGDIVVFGTPADAGGGHVSIVYSVNSDGTLTTVNGDGSAGAMPSDTTVTLQTIDPRTATAGDDNLPVSGYVSPPGVVTSPPPSSGLASGVSAVVHGSAIDVFATDASGRLVERFYSGGQWSGWQQLGGTLASGPSAVVTSDGTVHVFAVNTDHELVQKWYTTAGQWSGWQSFTGTLVSGPTAVVASDGTLHVFAVGLSRQLVQRWYTTAGDWSGWQDLGGTLAGESPSAVVTSDHTIHVFATDTDGGLVQKWYTSAGDWSGWQSFTGTLISGSSAVVASDGTLHVFAVGLSRQLVQRWYTTAGDWSGWQDLSGTLAGESPSAVVTSDGTIHVFAVDTNHTLVQKWYTTAGDWSGWQNLGGTLS